MPRLIAILSLLLSLCATPSDGAVVLTSRTAVSIGIHSLPFSVDPVPHTDTAYVRDTVKKLIRGLISPHVLLQKRTVDRTTVREQYVLEMTNPHLLTSELRVVGLSESFVESDVSGLTIEEFLQVHAHPTLGFVFFDANSADIPQRYEHISQRESKSYSLKSLTDQDDIDVHRSILNILAKRLVDHPQSTITVTGCNTDVDAERNNLALSRARAQSVKDYLTAIWGIDPARISVEARGLPEFSSSTKTQDGQEENRRVEINSSDSTLLDVFIASDTTRVPTPPMLRFTTSYQAGTTVDSWTLSISLQGKLIKRYTNQGPPPKNIDWDLTDEEKSSPRVSGPLEARLVLKNSLGDQTMSTVSIPTVVRSLRQKQLDHIADTTVERYNLVLFNYAKADLTAQHTRVLALLRSRLKPSSHISIEGFADRTGSTAANARISLARAEATKKALGREDAKVSGVGVQRLLLPNDTPEGRFLCRTVQINVHTPSR
jgi:outer membrane protein OmpA-like peptidoglycan-associated protein